MKFFDYFTQKVVTEIRLCDKYSHRQPQEVTIKYNKTLFWVKTMIVFTFIELLLLSELDKPNKELSTEYLIMTLIVGLLLAYFIIINFIRAINNKPIIVINEYDIKIKETHSMTWDSIKSIYIKEENNEESVDYFLCIESEDFNWSEDFSGFNMRMDEISHWLAYFKLKHLENNR